MNQNQKPEQAKVEASLAAPTKTPLEIVIGFNAAEETYDLLSIREQIILDLLIAGWTQADIALLYGVKAPSIASSVRRMRIKLAESKLKVILDARQFFREGGL